MVTSPLAMAARHRRATAYLIWESLTGHKRNVIRLELESPYVELAGYRLTVEEADGFSVLISVNPCICIGSGKKLRRFVLPRREEKASGRIGVPENWETRVYPELEFWTEDR